MSFKKDQLLILEKENRMLGSVGAQLAFFSEDGLKALINYGFSEIEAKMLLDGKEVSSDEIMNLQFRYFINANISHFNVERKKEK
ncbi:MAG: hypothetical protein CL760_05100 [Chloroflexi bacterium]|nr:hypothetical protein [Chloroflexota bacterium]|tara:strand:- start:1511 stop:1765 length:255 start_codon:yes stop_codon:yes gene_type:complete